MTFADAATALGPLAWFKHAETSGTTLVDDLGTYDGTYVGTPTLNQASIIDAGDATARLSGTNYATVDLPALSAFTMCAVVAVDDLNTFADYFSLAPSADVDFWTESGFAGLYLSNGTVTAYSLSDPIAATNGVPFLLTARFNGSTVDVLVNDAVVVTDSVAGPITVGAGTWQIGKGSAGYLADESLIFDRALTDVEVASLSAEIAPAAPVGPDPVGSDLSFGNYGYAYGGGETDLSWSVPVAEVPVGTPPPPSIPRVHHAVGVPSFDNGRPIFDAGAETVTAWVDSLRVTVGGRDVTYFRGVPTIIGGWQNLDPYGDAGATLTFPGITEFEEPGVGDLAWLGTPESLARVVINRVVDGVVVDHQDPLFDGLAVRPSSESGPLQLTCEGNYMGRQGRLLHQPYILHNQARTLKAHLIREHRKIYRADFQIVGDVDGPLIGSRGDRSMYRIGHVDHLLGLSIQEDGSSYTLLPDRSVARNAMRLQLRTMTTVDATVYAGAHGVKVSLAADPATNRVYIEGQGPDGGRYRNVVYPKAGYDDDAATYPKAGGASFGIDTTDADTINGDGIRILTRRLWSLGFLDSDDAGSTVFDDEVEAAVNDFREKLGLPQNGTVTTALWGHLYYEGFNQQSLDGAHFEPGAAKTETVQWLRGPGGVVVAPNPDYDRKVMPVEEFVSYGESVYKRGAKKNARAIINRPVIQVGTVTLTSDPAEMSRFEMRAGMTLLVKNLHGSGATGVKLYVSSVEVDWAGGSVTLAVATSPLHFIELATIRQRQVEARQNPAKRARQAFRHSGEVHDSVIGWDADGPSGIVPRHVAQAGQWNPFQVVACERGTLAEMRFVADNPTPFMVMVFGQKVNPAVLNRVIGNPFAWRGVDAGRTFSDGATTSASTTVTSSIANFVSGDEGRSVTGAGILAGTTVSEVVNGTTIHLSQSASATATGVNLTLGDFTEDRESTFSAHAEWLKKRLLSQAYGDPEEPGGYYPRRHTNDKGETTHHPATGILHDDASQAFVTQACELWVYVWPVEETMFHGRLKLVPED